MATTAYMVEAGEYEDRRVLVISLDQAAAQRYADHHNAQPAYRRGRGIIAEVSEIECLPADWAPPVIEVEPDEICEICENCGEEYCECAEPIGDDFPCCSTPGSHELATRRCTGCLGAGTGARCCICGGLR